MAVATHAVMDRRAAMALFVTACGGTVAIPGLDAASDSPPSQDAATMDGEPLLHYVSKTRPRDAAACLARPESTCSALRAASEDCFAKHPYWCGGWSVAFDEDGCATAVSSPDSGFTLCVESALASARFPCKRGMTMVSILSCGPK